MSSSRLCLAAQQFALVPLLQPFQVTAQEVGSAYVKPENILSGHLLQSRYFVDLDLSEVNSNQSN